MPNRHLVAIVGGAVSGAEAAATLAASGIECVVLEQNARPFGKIEDGLPRWHKRQRAMEFERIAGKLSLPGVHFIPCVRLGRDLDLDTLLSGWGVSAVLLATGAQRDRPLGLEGVDRYLGRGLLYQNALLQWFNHHEEAAYSGPRLLCEDGALIVGGGLASFDVAKILMLQTVGAALAARGLPIDMFTLEHRGIAAVLAERSLDLEKLGLRGCTLFYRRSAREMPVAPFKEGATPEERARTEEVRERLLANLQAKYLFRFEANHAPVGFLTQDARLAGLRFVRTETRDGRLEWVEGSEVDRPSRLVISSIGSIPEPLQGIPRTGELYDFDDLGTAQLRGRPRVFGVGNVVTGKGNIVVSRRHSSLVTEHILKDYLGLGQELATSGDTLFGAVEARAQAQVERVAEQIRRLPALTAAEIERIHGLVADLHLKAGYPGNLADWLEQVTPPDME